MPSDRNRTDPPRVDPRFIYIGTGVTASDVIGSTLAVPFPSEAMFETSRAVNAGRNANNVVVGQMVGRSVDKQNMKWRVLPRETWWKLNRWFEEHGMFFYCKYFAHNVGKWRIRRFYCGDQRCDPYKINPLTGVPDVYLNCTVNIIDMGEDYTQTVSDAMTGGG